MKTKDWPNYYENLSEAHRRLLNTVVLYDDDPYKILAITAHKSDGIFRAYLEPMEDKKIYLNGYNFNGYFPAFEYPFDHNSLGDMLDTWMDNNKNAPLLRKQLNSPKFNKFRPFRLGMANYSGEVTYLERMPLRKGEQGLIEQSVTSTTFELMPKPKNKFALNSSQARVPFNTTAFRNCCKGIYPTAIECIEALNDPDITNSGAAFHRDFALIRGPLSSIYLAYKEDIIGFLPDANFNKLKIDVKFRHTIEAIEELSLFENVYIGG